MNLNFHQLIYWMWISIGLFWVVGFLGTKSTVRRQPLSSRLPQLVFEISAGYLLFAKTFPPMFRTHLFPQTLVSNWSALVIAFLGALIAIWARLTLGTNWSARVTIKDHHELIRSGPYSFVRHPIYSGLLLMVLGTAVQIAELRGFIALLLAFTGFVLKSRLEDSFMRQQFGDEYAQYKHQVKAMIPWIF